MKQIFLMMVIGFLAACGADGAPIRPSAFLGLSFGSDGVSQVRETPLQTAMLESELTSDA